MADTWTPAALFSRREFSLLLLIIGIALAVGWKDPEFLNWQNICDILVRSGPTAIVACGVMLVVVSGEIDISVGSLMGFLAAILGILSSSAHWNLPLWIGLPSTVMAGTSIGFVTGLMVTYGRVPSIIATLGLLTALRGLTMIIMQGENIDGLPERLTFLAKYGVGGLPISLWTAAVVIAATGVLVHYTATGRRLYALGSSSYSAKMLGLSRDRLRLFSFGYVGLLTAIATIVDVPRLPKIEAGIGSGFELLVITCVVVGGVSISGGRGTLLGVLLATILLTMVRPVLTFLDVGEAGEKWTKAIQGAFIMLAIIVDSVRDVPAKRRRARSLPVRSASEEGLEP